MVRDIFSFFSTYFLASTLRSHKAEHRLPTGQQEVSILHGGRQDKNTCTDDTPLGRRKQEVPQKTDETGNIAAILSNRPTVRQILTSAGLILIALCTVRAS